MDSDAVAAWAEAPTVPFPRGAPVIAAVLAAAVAVTFGLYMAQITSRTPFLAALLIELGYAFFLGSRTLRVSAAVSSPARDLALLAKLLERLENERFEAPLLARMQAGLKESGLVASEEIARLRRLVSRLDWQRNLLFTPIAMAILWGAQVAMAIERWRQCSGPHIRAWIAGVGEFESLFSLAGYSFEHPRNTFPELTDVKDGWFDAAGLCHPLIPEAQCIPNDLRLGGDLRLLIVSGSNMSGKSTLLRSVGLNTALAWAGAPVCASRLAISPLMVGASIRVLDSVQDGRSRFYAEITRLREIVNLTTGPSTALFLIDELLSGTNSHDRRIGASAIVRSLIDRGAIGMITTHDLALAHIAEDLPGRAVNVHFADTFENGRLHFDYRLHPGVVERSNALGPDALGRPGSVAQRKPPAGRKSASGYCSFLLRSPMNPAVHGLLQFIQTHRLADVVVHARRQTAFAITLHGIGGKRADGRPASAPLTASNDGCRLEAIHIGHLAIHQHQIVFPFLQSLHSLASIDHRVGSQPEFLEQPQRDPLVDFVIFSQQYP